MGIVGCPLLVADEPGSWQTIGGELMFDAIQTAQGKPGSPLRAIYIGTLAPATGGWWHKLVGRGSVGSAYVQAIKGDPAKWDRWPEIRRCNPLTAVDAKFRGKLREERDEAKADESMKARFLSMRLNVPTMAESKQLFTPAQWEAVLARPVPERMGLPIVGIDLGESRAWSAAVGIWQTGRVEAVAVAPGVPDLEAQEKRDRVPRGTYRRLVDEGVLLVADGQQVPEPAQLAAAIGSRWGAPARVVSDFFRAKRLEDALGFPVEPRRNQWKEGTEDIVGARRLGLDWHLGVEERSRMLLTYSISRLAIDNDTSGNQKCSKDARDNSGRDDVACALVLAAGAADRARSEPTRTLRVY